jgi:2-methylisocitrate lyase-like PEP mutase family enzyme
VIPNPWDVASTRILEGLGFQAIATSSAASACAMGRRDGELTRDEALAHPRMIVNATDLPVSADLERGFGDTPHTVAETIWLAAEAGLVGCTIEDTTGNQDRPLYDFDLCSGKNCCRRAGNNCTRVSLHSDCASAQSHVREPER